MIFCEHASRRAASGDETFCFDRRGPGREDSLRRGKRVAGYIAPVERYPRPSPGSLCSRCECRQCTGEAAQRIRRHARQRFTSGKTIFKINVTRMHQQINSRQYNLVDTPRGFGPAFRDCELERCQSGVGALWAQNAWLARAGRKPRHSPGKNEFLPRSRR